MTTPNQTTPPAPRRDLVIAFLCGGLVAGMVGLSFAAVPFYSWFCRTTGFGGTTQVAHALPTREVSGRLVTVYYTVTNEAARVTAGQAGYNVTPPTVGIYFEKINCFCFTQQTLKAGETRDLAVVFYVDPKLAADSEQNGTNRITLSYTFYPAKAPEQPVAVSVPQPSAPSGGG